MLNGNNSIEKAFSNAINHSMFLGSKVKEYEIEDNKNEFFVRLD